MPRKAFVTDLQEAIRDFRHDRILNLSFGSEDGSITFRYVLTDATVAEATVQALVPGKLGVLKDWVFFFNKRRRWRLPDIAHVHGLYYL